VLWKNKRRFSALSLVTAITLTFSFIPISQAATRNIGVSSFGLYPTAQVGSIYDIQMGLKSNAKIVISKSFIKISKNKTIVGLPALEKGSDRDGLWNIRFRIPEYGPLGTYKIFIEVQSGKNKLVINDKSVKFVIKTIDEYKSSPNFRFGLEKTCGAGLATCPKVSLPIDLNETEVCKIKDATPLDYQGRVSVGFPINKKYLAGQKDVKLAWIPISFSDRKFDDNLFKRSKDVAAQAQGFYAFNSFGRVKFSFQVPPQEKWINLPNPVSYYEKDWSNKTIAQVTQFLLDNSGTAGADFADSITFNLPLGKYNLKFLDGYDTGVIYKLNGATIPSERVYVINPFEGEVGDPGSFAHGIGHSLYGFEDLYLSPFYSGLTEDAKPASFWDIMAGGGDFFGWSKWIAGWLLDSEVTCLTNTQKMKTVYLKSFQDPTGPKLVGIPVGNNEIVLAEFRTNTTNKILEKYGLCDKKSIVPCSTYQHSGLLIYKLDTKLHHLEAPFRVAQTVEQKLLLVGDTLTFEGQTFKVVASDGNGIYVEIRGS